MDQRGTVFMHTFKWKSKVQNSMCGILVFVKKKIKKEFMYLFEYAWNISRKSNKDLLATGEENWMVETWGWRRQTLLYVLLFLLNLESFGCNICI